MLALGSVGSGWVLEQSSVTLMHGHELYYALAAAYSQIHLSNLWVIYVSVSTICLKISHGKKEKAISQRNKTDLLMLVIHFSVENKLRLFKTLLQLNSNLYMGGSEHLHKHMAQYNKPALQVKIHHSICIWQTVMFMLWMEERRDKKPHLCQM